MIKKLICFLWGHKIVHKSFTGRTIKTLGPLGNQQINPMYVYTTTDFCTRCGKKIKD